MSGDRDPIDAVGLGERGARPGRPQLERTLVLLGPAEVAAVDGAQVVAVVEGHPVAGPRETADEEHLALGALGDPGQVVEGADALVAPELGGYCLRHRRA